MRTAIIVTVTSDQQLELPPDIKEQLKPRDEYLIWQTEDTILLKKIQKSVTFEDLLQRIEDVGLDPNQPSEVEIYQIVKDVRYARGNHESHS